MKKKLLFPAAAALSLITLTLSEAYKFAFCRDPGVLFTPLDKKKHKAAFYIRRDEAHRAMEALPRRRCCIKGGQGEELVGYYYQCGESPAGKIAFIVHGYRSDHADTAGLYLPGWFQRGFDVFACDHTAHGDSGGKHIGFDFFEIGDCLKWLDFLRAGYGSDVTIVLHGFSMGGAIVLGMSDKIPDNVPFIIEDSGYNCAENLIRATVGPMYGLLRHINRLFSGYDLEDTDVRPALKNARCPILFIHGGADETVPCEMGPELYGLCPTEKDCLFLPGVGHVETMHSHSGQYWAKIDSFLEKYMNK